MNELIEYKIPFKGLSSNEHSFDFRIDGRFFEAMQSDEDFNCDIRVDLLMDIQSTMIILNFSYKGEIILPCDVCLELFPHDINLQHRIIVKYGDDISDDDDIIIIQPSEYQIDVSQIIYEDIVLNIPIKKVHPPDKNGNSTCNPKALELLEKFHRKEKKEDPRWDALKNLKFED